jgi:hypothetical protein
MTNKPWIDEAIAAGRQVPTWIAERAATREQFEELLALRERAFPETKPGGQIQPASQGSDAMTTHVYRGYLFLHADSRGGTTFVQASSLDAALKHYALAAGYEPGKPLQFDEIPTGEFLANLRDEDYLGEVEIHSDELLDPARYLDLDGRFTGEFAKTGKTAWVQMHGAVANVEDDDISPGEWANICQVSGTPPIIRYGARPGPDWVAPRWDDDAFGLLMDRASEQDDLFATSTKQGDVE